MMASLGKFETLGEIQTIGGNRKMSENRDARNDKIGNGAEPAFLLYLRIALFLEMMSV